MLFLERVKRIIYNEKIKSNEQIESEVSLKTIAEIPLKEDKNSVELISCEKEKSPSFKAFKKLITNIQFLCVNKTADKKVMLVTSPESKTGKSYVVANMAISFAGIGKKVLIIDADMSNGRQDKIFNIPNNLGLSNYLSNLDANGVEINEFLSKFINETAIKNINLITAGTVPPNPDELLSLSRFTEMIKDAKVFFDIILIDSSEVLNKAEALILARHANSTIIVASCGKTSIEDLENTKKDIQNVGGKILGVVLNDVKLKKENKTREQRKEEFSKFRLKVKEKINDTIERIKRKINKSNQKLLEEAKKQEAIDESKSLDNEKIDNVLNQEKIDDNIDNNFTSKKELSKAENDTQKVFFVEMLKNIKFPDKKALKEESESSEEIIEQKSNVEIKKEEKQEEQIEEQFEEKNEDKNNDTDSESKILLIFFKIKAIVLDKINIIKEKMIEHKTLDEKETKESEKKEKVENYSSENIKKKIVNLYSNSKKYCIEKYNSLKEINRKTETKDNSDKENLKTEDIIDNKNDLEKKEILDDSIKNEKMLLIIVDAENGYCRAFSKEYFAERLVRGIDKKTGYSIAHYSPKNLKRKQEYFMERYQLTEIQAKRIDALIYDTLKDYDEYLWIERKMLSDKAENYALAISKEFEKNPEESKKQYKTRCQRLRKTELEKAELDIEYKLDNLWKTTKINVLDKLKLNKFAKFYEIDKNMKNDSEIMKSKKTKKFYTDIIAGAEKKLEKANKEDRKKEETEKQVIEEDRKIKQEELKLEQQQLELEKRAAQERIKLEQENVKAEKKAEQERIKEEKRKEREIERIERKEENFRRKKEKQKQKEEVKFQKEREKVKQREEAKLEEELLVDNLYPKTKHNKNLQ